MNLILLNKLNCSQNHNSYSCLALIKTQYTFYKGIDYSPQTLFFKYLSLQADGINP